MNRSEIVERSKRLIFGRQIDYRQVFNLTSPVVVRVLADLAKFCRANETTFHQDPRAHAVMEGRREVWLRIAKNLRLSQDDLWKLYGRTDLE